MSLVTSTPTNNLFYARPHLNPLPRGEDFSNHGLGDLIDCPANPGARIFKGTADDAPCSCARSKAAEGRRSPRRWRVIRRPPNCAKRLGVRQPSGALGGRDDCPANPGARIFKGTADDSPAP